MVQRLSIQHATLAFAEDAGLFGVDLTVNAGEIHALLGLNGSGKTTLIQAILRMLRLHEGTISFEGVQLSDLPAGAWRRVGHLVNQPFAYPELDAATNLALAARLKGVDKAQIPSTVDAAITDLGLERYRHVAARRLSQGNRQRVGLAAALQHHPDLVVLDEPTSTLDPAGVLRLRKLLLHRADQGAAILVSSHHLDEVARIADRIWVLNYGRLIGELEPSTSDLERAFFQMVHAHDELRTS